MMKWFRQLECVSTNWYNDDMLLKYSINQNSIKDVDTDNSNDFNAKILSYLYINNIRI